MLSPPGSVLWHPYPQADEGAPSLSFLEHILTLPPSCHISLLRDWG